jgi:hypothetical protein
MQLTVTLKPLLSEEVAMADVLYVAMMIALTAIGVMFVIGCDKIIGPDELALAEEPRAREQREPKAEELVA